ncbi:hypothetical protein ACFL6U_09005 [Planctomycetota bacterium]
MTSNLGQAGDPLKLEAIFSKTQIQRLAAHWITTPQQILAVGATDEGRGGLAQLLEIDLVSLVSVLDRLAGQMSPEEVRRLQDIKEGGQLGVILPPDVEQPE